MSTWMRVFFVIILLGTLDLNLRAEIVIASDFGWSAADATVAFKNAINSAADTVIVDLQSSHWFVAPCEFYDLRDKTIIFQPGVQLVAKPGAFTHNNDCLLRLVRSRNIRIIGYGATFRMQKEEYAALADGEWRHALSVNRCSDVEVSGLTIRDSGGDGLYVSGDYWDGQPLYSQNVLFKDIWCDNNYRQGISVISARNLMVLNCWFTSTSGTLPMSGVDLEPNNKFERMVDVVFEKCRFTGNSGNGIQLSFHNLDSTSEPVDITFRDCYVSDNHDPDHPYAAAEIQAGGNVRGNVLFERCMVENSQWTAVFVRKPADGYFIQFRDCVFKDVSQNTSDSKYNSPLWFEVTSYSQPCPRFGGTAFTDCLLAYSTPYHFLDSYGNAITSPGLGNVQLNNLTIVHPDSSVSYRVTNGGGSPSEDCIFDFHVYTVAPSAIIEFFQNPDLDECSGVTGIFQVHRNSGHSDYPLGISYLLSGSADQGADFGRMAGSIIIPAHGTEQSDTIRIFDDGMVEPDENIVIELNESSLFEAGSQPMPYRISDCESFIPGNSDVDGIFSLYPNPVTDRLVIQLVETEGGMLQLIDSQGNIVLIKDVRGGENRIDVGGLKEGVYCVRLIIASKDYNRKMIKL